ncbi:unnamed protein product, partial [Bubo scandiacus]
AGVGSQQGLPCKSGAGQRPAGPGTLQCRQRPEPPVSRGAATLAAALRAQLPFVQSSRLRAQLQRRPRLHAWQPRSVDRVRKADL